MAKAKKKKNPKVVMRASDLRRTRRQDIDAAYRMFMAVALTTALDKYEAGAGNGGAVSHILKQLDELKAAFPDAADRIDGIKFCVECIQTEPWLSSYLADMNKMVDEIMAGHVSVDDLAGVLDDEYDIRLDYETIK